MNRLKEFLLPFRLVVDDALLREYFRALSMLTYEELDTAISIAVREAGEYAPAPGVIYGIAMELREGSEFIPAPQRCALCDETKFRRVQVPGPGPGPYYAVVPCECMISTNRKNHAKFLRKHNPACVSRADGPFVDAPREDSGPPTPEESITLLDAVRKLAENKSLPAEIRCSKVAEDRARDLANPEWVQGMHNLNAKLSRHYATQSTDPNLPRSQFEIEAVEQATGRRIAKPRRRQ